MYTLCRALSTPTEHSKTAPNHKQGGNHRDPIQSKEGYAFDIRIQGGRRRNECAMVMVVRWCGVVIRGGARGRRWWWNGVERESKRQ